MIRYLVLMAILISGKTVSADTNIALVFVKKSQELCPNYSPLFSKKLLIAILKAEKNGLEPCELEQVTFLTSKCEIEDSCKKLVGSYQKIIDKTKGRVFGEKND